MVEPFADLKMILEARRTELRRDLDERLRDIRTQSGEDEQGRSRDSAEASDSDLQQDIDIALTEMTAEVLRDVDQALQRLATSDYGVCADCGGPIAESRLRALPFALRCRDCEEEYERRAKRPLRLAAGRTTSLARLAQLPVAAGPE
jgi:RNA polymerase-binding transcription factor